MDEGENGRQSHHAYAFECFFCLEGAQRGFGASGVEARIPHGGKTSSRREHTISNRKLTRVQLQFWYAIASQVQARCSRPGSPTSPLGCCCVWNLSVLGTRHDAPNLGA